MTPLLRQTIFSPCRKYRYLLYRDWPSDGATHDRFVQFVGLNPSVADEEIDDNTVRRCIGFAKRWGFGAMVMTNIFAFRATDPKVMYAEAEPVGVENNSWLCQVAMEADLIVAAWGTHGAYRNRGSEVLNRLRCLRRKIHSLGLTMNGFPKHPLYLSSDTQPEIWHETQKAGEGAGDADSIDAGAGAPTVA